MLILSLIPIPFYTFKFTIYNNNYRNSIWFCNPFDLNKGLLMVLSSIPHTIIELAMCFVISGLYKLNKTIIRKISNLLENKTKLFV